MHFWKEKAGSRPKEYDYYKDLCGLLAARAYKNESVREQLETRGYTRVPLSRLTENSASYAFRGRVIYSASGVLMLKSSGDDTYLYIDVRPRFTKTSSWALRADVLCVLAMAVLFFFVNGPFKNITGFSRETALGVDCLLAVPSVLTAMIFIAVAAEYIHTRRAWKRLTETDSDAAQETGGITDEK